MVRRPPDHGKPPLQGRWRLSGGRGPLTSCVPPNQAAVTRASLNLPAGIGCPMQPCTTASCGDTLSALHRLVSGWRACLGLFASADALGLGLASGVPPHVYAPRS
jgi:hypothetical protein